MLWLNKLIYKEEKDVCFFWLLLLNASQFSPYSFQNNGLKVNRQAGCDTSYFSKHPGRKKGRERSGLLSCKLNIKSCEACIAEFGNTSSITINIALSQREHREANNVLLSFNGPSFKSRLSGKEGYKIERTILKE